MAENSYRLQNGKKLHYTGKSVEENFFMPQRSWYFYNKNKNNNYYYFYYWWW